MSERLGLYDDSTRYIRSFHSQEMAPRTWRAALSKFRFTHWLSLAPRAAVRKCSEENRLSRLETPDWLNHIEVVIRDYLFIHSQVLLESAVPLFCCLVQMWTRNKEQSSGWASGFLSIPLRVWLTGLGKRLSTQRIVNGTQEEEFFAFAKTTRIFNNKMNSHHIRRWKKKLNTKNTNKKNVTSSA